MNSAENKKTDTAHIPQFFPTQIITAARSKINPAANPFDLMQHHFAALAEAEQFTMLLPELIEINIAEEISLLDADSSLEITVPVVALTDLLGGIKYIKMPQQFAVVVGLNGFGAKSPIDGNDNFPRPDFVLVTDIIGNQYEIIVNQDGQLELPHDGTGLFSIISSITFIFSERQVAGHGLKNLTSQGMKVNKLYLLGPVESTEKYPITICVTHINEFYQRIVDSIRTVEIHSAEFSKEIKEKIVIRHLEEDPPQVLNVNMSLLLLTPFLGIKPFSASVTLENMNGAEYSFQNAKGWLQHPIEGNIFTKYFGLSEKTLTYLVHDIYSQYDFMKNYLNGDHFSISDAGGYNNFLLRPEAFGIFYDYLVNDLVNQRMIGDFLFERVPEEHLIQLNLAHLPLDFHDSVVLKQLQSDLQDHHTDSLKQLFLKNDDRAIEINDHFSVYAGGLNEILPKASLTLSYDQPFYEKVSPVSSVTPDILSDFYVNEFVHSNKLGYFEDHFQLGLKQIPTTIHLHEVVEGDPTHADLSTLFGPAGWTPLMSAQEKNKPVEMTVTQEDSDPIRIDAKVQVHPLTSVEIDSQHIFFPF